MIAEGLEYYLQDEEELQKKMESESDYCKACGSCCESGCCSPSKCEKVRCMYGEYNLKEYKDLLDENEELRNLLQELADICDWSIESDQYDEDEKESMGNTISRLESVGIKI